jgi:AbiV family abortive infection protein
VADSGKRDAFERMYKREETQSATAPYLLEGAVYALEQCGLLLRDADLLYRNRSFATAVVLAAFAREELGRWQILLKLRKEVLGGRQLSLKDVGARWGKHEPNIMILCPTLRTPVLVQTNKHQTKTKQITKVLLFFSIGVKVKP